MYMADRKVGKRSMGKRGRSKMDSGTCNVCSAPCSSCRHRSVGFAASKSEESSDETCHGIAVSQCSVNGDDVLRLSSKAPSNSPTASEASILVNTSHDALFENADSKKMIRSSEVSDDSGAIETSSKESSAEIGVKHRPLAIANVLDQSSKCVKGQEDRTVDDRAKSLNSDYPNDRAGNKDSSDCIALASDSVLDGCNKYHAKSQSLPYPSSNHEDRNSLGLGKTKEKSGAESNRDNENIRIEGSTHSSQDYQNDKSGKKAKLHKAEEPNSSAMSENESDDSEMVEHDVKVCDICGDAGREDLLAICSRCSDGAEHTYCMREMLDEVPKGDWLCEECKFAEEAEKQKLEAKGKRETEVNLNVQIPGKRRAEKAEAAPDAKRQAIEASTVSPKKSVLPRIASLSRESSFKGLDKTKRKLVHQASFTSLLSGDAENTRSTGSQLQSPKGTFFKSNSFNASSKPKVKPIDEVVLPRQRSVKEHVSLDMKEGVSRTVAKSMSIRSSEVGCLISNDLKGKVKGRQLKDQSAEVNSPAPMGDQKLISRGNSSLFHAKNTRDLKGLQADVKLGSLTRQASNLSRSRAENPVASVGESSINEKGNSSEQISSQTNRKDEPQSISGLAEGLSRLTSHANVSTQDVVPRSRESGEMGEKSKDVLINRPRSSLLSGPKDLASQKESQAAEPIDTSCASDTDLCTTRSYREDINKGNRLRAAVDAALRKKPSFGKNRGSEQPDGSSVSNMEPSCDKTSHSQLPLKTTKNSTSFEGPQGGQPNLRTASDPYKQTITTNGKQFAFSAADTVYSPRSEDLEVNYPSIKPIPRDWPFVPSNDMSKTSAIPEHEYIWQGDFEVQRSRNLLETHSGIQAHLSTLASPKVLEAVNKFPLKVSLNEVPRLSTWPAQFRDGTKEDHIALFFFAKDIESYEKNYKPLVDNMIKKDLALKGNFGGVELLIFASNQLPQLCQRWNMLFFLWGVFRGRKESSSDQLKNNPSLPPTSNVLLHDRGANVSNRTHPSLKHLENMPSAHETSCCTTEAERKVGVVRNEDRNNKESSIERSSIGSEVNNKDSNLSPRFMSSSTQSCPKEEKTSKEDGFNDGEKTSSASSGDGLVKRVQHAEEQKKIGISIGAKEKETPASGENPPFTATDFEGRYGGRGQADQRKRLFLDLTEPAMDDSSGVDEKVWLNDSNSGSICEGSANKKLKIDPRGENERLCISGNSSHNDSASRKHDVGPSSSTEMGDHRSREEKIIEKDPDAAERIVFPLDLNDGKEDIEMEDNPIIPMSGNRQMHDGLVPNLELALGADETTTATTGNVGVLPFLSGKVNEYGSQLPPPRDQMISREKHEEEAASLVLSLAFPFPEEQQSQGPPVSSSEEERQKNVNAPPLFLFRDFSDKL
ncbi:PREDICTED: uncharacterized protein LOC104803125 [Tarenaya hassleriana]|uniref:uncharacterized protein LOC104803125 n=1 Tax=Tarenaya hassleriana TaxID=28532 RepID=UPI00053C4759|nr:PREDICTED: uncharacterized protein LOC104803125 [Tarenaya hassleriana]